MLFYGYLVSTHKFIDKYYLPINIDRYKDSLRKSTFFLVTYNKNNNNLLVLFQKKENSKVGIYISLKLI